jgi:hypothetical protein
MRDFFCCTLDFRGGPRKAWLVEYFFVSRMGLTPESPLKCS